MPVIPQFKIGEAIKGTRLKLHMTQQTLSILTGIGERSINYWENGKKTPHLSSLLLVADAFQMDLKIIYRSNKQIVSVDFVQQQNDRLTTYDELISDKRIQDRLYADCLLMTGNANEAKGLAQETTMRALLYQHRYNQEKCQLYTWMRGIAKNAWKAIKYNNNKLTYIEDYLESGSPDDIDETVNHKAYQYVNKLSGKRRDLYRMRLNGLTYDQIASEIGASPQYIKTRFFQIRREMQALVNE